MRHMQHLVNQIEIMQAYVDGRPVETISRTLPSDRWQIIGVENPILRFDWFRFDYRIAVVPKPKVKRWQWVYESPNKAGPPGLTGNFYKNEEEVRRDYSGIFLKILGPAEWTELEFDE